MKKVTQTLMDVYNAKVDRVKGRYYKKDDILGCMIDVTNDVQWMWEEGWMEPNSTTITIEGRKVVEAKIKERLEK